LKSFSFIEPQQCKTPHSQDYPNFTDTMRKADTFLKETVLVKSQETILNCFPDNHIIHQTLLPKGSKGFLRLWILYQAFIRLLKVTLGNY
jgi:hypothetical protein